MTHPLEAENRRLREALTAAWHALESYAHENGSTELAVSIAAYCKAALAAEPASGEPHPTDDDFVRARAALILPIVNENGEVVGSVVSSGPIEDESALAAESASGEPRVVLFNEDHGVCIGGRWDGWIMWKHPDGQWVSLRKPAPEVV